MREVLGKFWVKTHISPEHRSRIQGIFDSLLKGESGPQYAECPVLSKRGRKIRTYPGLDQQKEKTAALPLSQSLMASGRRSWEKLTFELLPVLLYL